MRYGNTRSTKLAAVFRPDGQFNDESEYNEKISEVAQWCKVHHLLLNAAKTKELIFDFRHCTISHVPLSLSIDNSIVEMCDNFKY